MAIGLGLMLLAVFPVGLAIVLYDTGNGVFSIAKSTLPLALFGPQLYATLIGRLARPSLIAQAVAQTGALLLEASGFDLGFRGPAIARVAQCRQRRWTVVVAEALALRQ